MTIIVRITFVLLLALSGSRAQTRVQPSQIAMSSLYKEGDWCPGDVFTLATPTRLIFTKDASPQNTCFLHAANMPQATSPTAPFTYSVSQWTQSATIDIQPAPAPFDDTVFFYWIAAPSPTLHVIGHTSNFLCNGCIVDTPRDTDTFPAQAIIAGFYSVVGGSWALSGHPIVDHHQIYSDVPTAVFYLPETGYFFMLDRPDATAAQVAKQVQLTNEAVQKAQSARLTLQAETAQAQAKIAKKTAKGLQARMDEVEASVKTHVEEGSPREVSMQINDLRAQIEALRGQQQMSGERLMDERQVWLAEQRNFLQREVAPPAAPGACEANTWFRKADIVYWCLGGLWVKTEVWK